MCVANPHRQDREPIIPGKGSTALTVAPDWQAVLVSNGWEDLDDIFSLVNDASLSKPGLPHWRERIRTTLTDAGREVTVYVKRFHNVPLSQQIRRWWSGDPGHATAWAEWAWLWELGRAGISAAEPIAYGEEMTGWWEHRSAVVMGAVGGVSLERWCTEHDEPFPEALPDALAELVARFHGLGIAHRDLYLSHIFGERLDTATPQLSIIDLQRVVRLGRRRRRWIVKDLAALNYSTPPTALSVRGRLRWLKRYVQLCEKGDVRKCPRSFRLRRQDRVLLRRILGRAEQMRRHDARRGRL
ncbi:MAG: hypothetical protein KAV82_12645 [Phycisphaerae bacterium]|nr:hypothetical protein [Phycisphaerae bacterium]